MPLYEYQCLKCLQVWELLRKVSEDAASLPACPKCKSTQSRKLVSKVAAVRALSQSANEVAAAQLEMGKKKMLEEREGVYVRDRDGHDVKVDERDVEDIKKTATNE